MRNRESYRAHNEFKVQKRVWTSWTLTAKHVFNKTYESMMKDPDLFRHTEDKTTEVNPKFWRVIAWNAAFTAASICSRGERIILKDVVERFK